MSAMDWSGLTSAITTPRGTVVRLVIDDGEVIVECDQPTGPDHMRNHRVGTVIAGNFHPAPNSTAGLSPDVLLAIARVIDRYVSSWSRD